MNLYYWKMEIKESIKLTSHFPPFNDRSGFELMFRIDDPVVEMKHKSVAPI